VATHALATVLSVAATGCLPYPLQSPRVEPGATLGLVTGLRVFARDTTLADGTRLGPVPFPELVLSPSLGFAHADGTGPAFRVGGTIGFGPWEGDAYFQLPRIGPLVAGAGALEPLVRTTDGGRIHGASPYAMIGWQVQNETMLYGSLSGLSIHHPTSPRPAAPDTAVSVRVIMIGLQHTRVRAAGEGSTSWRAFLALFHGNKDVESGPTFFEPSPLRSLFVAGVSFDATRLFGQPGVPRRRRPPL
jgi:hypothetical protein